MGRDVSTGLARVTERAHSDALARELGFPQFDRPVWIDAARSWIAHLASIGRQGDPEVLFYAVTLLRNGREVGRIFAEVRAAEEERTAALQRELGRVAWTGQANTDYRGSVLDSCNGWFQDTVDLVPGW